VCAAVFQRAAVEGMQGRQADGEEYCWNGGRCAAWATLHARTLRWWGICRDRGDRSRREAKCQKCAVLRAGGVRCGKDGNDGSSLHGPDSKRAWGLAPSSRSFRLVSHFGTLERPSRGQRQMSAVWRLARLRDLVKLVDVKALIARSLASFSSCCSRWAPSEGAVDCELPRTRTRILCFEGATQSGR
jgi:hypothetical protein